MTDQERAAAIVEGLKFDLATSAHNDEIQRNLIEEFTAVRIDERRAIVASLVAQYGASCRLTGGLFTGEAFLRAIESIERGEHGS